MEYNERYATHSIRRLVDFMCQFSPIYVYINIELFWAVNAAGYTLAYYYLVGIILSYHSRRHWHWTVLSACVCWWWWSWECLRRHDFSAYANYTRRKSQHPATLDYIYQLVRCMETCRMMMCVVALPACVARHLHFREWKLKSETNRCASGCFAFKHFDVYCRKVKMFKIGFALRGSV